MKYILRKMYWAFTEGLAAGIGFIIGLWITMKIFTLI